MRCGCPACGQFMVQQESGDYLGCVCPDCGYRCDACMGTDTVLSRDEIARYQHTGLGRLDQLAQWAQEDSRMIDEEQAEYDPTEDDAWMSDMSGN